MVDRERVIKGLEDVKETLANMRDWQGTTWVDDAIALLKAQEPRVMTLEEARSAFVIEYRSGKLKEVGMKILDIDVDPANAYYGVLYRVWTSRPSDEQMEAEPWE